MSQSALPRPRAAAGGTTRRPLPPGTYWRRRVFVVGTAVALVILIAQALTGGADGRDGTDGNDAAVDPVAEQAGAPVESGAEAGSQGSQGPDSGADAAPTTESVPVAPVDPATIAPSGECSPDDVAITPSVAEASVAGQDVAITLSLQTITAQACTFAVGPESVMVKIAQDATDLWSSQQCPGAVASASVVVRQAVPATVGLTWNARESSAQGCARRADWVLPGDFTIVAAPLGGEPRETAFALGAPAPQTVVVTERPKKEKPNKPVN